MRTFIDSSSPPDGVEQDGDHFDSEQHAHIDFFVGWSHATERVTGARNQASWSSLASLPQKLGHPRPPPH